jgi:hypothetical protein
MVSTSGIIGKAPNAYIRAATLLVTARDTGAGKSGGWRRINIKFRGIFPVEI